MNRPAKLCVVVGGVGLAVVLAMPPVASANLLTNPGFEDGLNGWITFGNVYPETSNPPQFVPHSGDGLASMFGNWTGGFNVSGLFQEFPAAPGSDWTLDVYSRHWSGDALTADGTDDNWVVQKIVFKDLNDVELPGAVESTIMDGTFPTDVWIDNAPISATAPEGTVQVEAFVLYLQPLYDGGAVHLDDAVFTPEPTSLAILALGGLALLGRRRR
jgi:hypothetical protein